MRPLSLILLDTFVLYGAPLYATLDDECGCVQLSVRSLTVNLKGLLLRCERKMFRSRARLVAQCELHAPCTAAALIRQLRCTAPKLQA